ncbi:MAG: SBBP repeat-containing protein, partial [Acidobacteria bacterium]|nr:SBBP repeat-containing protein [Acidobacteriota bacterium]
SYARVRYESVYPGVDLVYYGNQRQLEYDFVVAPGADPGAIKLAFEGARSIERDASGNLILRTAGGDLRMHKPVVYQEVGGVKRLIPGRYVVASKQQVGFHVAAYDRSKPLVIDPVLVYSTFLGGSGNDFGFRIAVDSAGNAYVTGGTDSTNFPGPGGIAAPKLGSSAKGAGGDVFVTKLNPAGTALVYSTYLGGSGNDGGIGIAVDSAGNAYVTGTTNSADFPTTLGAFDVTFNGVQDVFVTKLNPAGSALVYSTYLGGSGFERPNGIAVDSAGNAYVMGRTTSTISTNPLLNFPTTAGAFQTIAPGGDAFNPQDVFVTKLNPAGSALVYSTFLGGNRNDEGVGMAVDSAGNAYVTGFTTSTNFPTTAGAFAGTLGGPQDAFVTKLDAAGSDLVYSTYLGGSGGSLGIGIAVDSAGNAYVTGQAFSNFPTTASAFQATQPTCTPLPPPLSFLSCSVDAFVAKIDPSQSGI